MAMLFTDNKQLGFFKSAVGVNTLAKILPNMCKAVGVKVKTSHTLRVTCATALFGKDVEEKLIRNRTVHRSNALLKYEKSSSEQNESVSNILTLFHVRMLAKASKFLSVI